MPRDGELRTRQPLKPGLAGLAQLRDELRKPMPDTHTWDFGVSLQINHCGTAGCAMGLAYLIWPQQAPKYMLPRQAAPLFGLTLDEAEGLFMPRGYRADVELVTPTMVADEIDKLLREKGYVEGVAR